MFRNLIAASLIWFPSLGFANCDFVTSLYSKELQNLASVERLDIEVKKSRKWAANGLKMILDDREFIHPKWKKKFKAEITVTYPFGSCVYDAKVRQNGDWRDHQEFKDGELRQSLDVGLKNGNIANVVDFKLFLPNTRNGNSETLATLILRKLDILAPKTASLDVSVNGIEVEYLFQEKESKELIEAMGRREGPLFKGDEFLLWSFDGFQPMDLLTVSASRLANHKWARRGESSTKMALDAYLELQLQYLHYASQTLDNNRFFIDPNARLDASSGFQRFHAAVLAFSGWHGLWGLNRKQYWNALAGEFEPIYYDGNVNFEELSISKTTGKRPIEMELFREHFKDFDFANLSAQIEALLTDEFVQEFAGLANLSFDDARRFALPKLEQVIANFEVLRQFAAEETDSLPIVDYPKAIKLFVSANESFGLEQRLLIPQSDGASGKYSFGCIGHNSCEPMDLTLDDVVDLMAKQKFDGERHVILPTATSANVTKPHKVTRAGSIAISHSATARVEFDRDANELLLHQSEASDWFLIRNTSIGEISISLVGLNAPSSVDPLEQRFNEFGLTGCLTFFKVTFENTGISASDGACEDSLNIVSSRGDLKSITIENGFSDAIDLDFSQLTINSVHVAAAGNDCFDVSGGDYKMANAHLIDCGDKGISVGENSRVEAGDVVVNGAGIGASSKDFSDVRIAKFATEDVRKCLEAFQKKSEFGGARIEIATENCDRSTITHDANSVIVLDGERLELSN